MELKPQLLTLLSEILLNNWRYFFKCRTVAALQVAAMMSRPETDTGPTAGAAASEGLYSGVFVPEETLEHEPEFRKIMEVHVHTRMKQVTQYSTYSTVSTYSYRYEFSS